VRSSSLAAGPSWQARQSSRMNTGCGRTGGAPSYWRVPPRRSCARPSKVLAWSAASSEAISMNRGSNPGPGRRLSRPHDAARGVGPARRGAHRRSPRRRRRADAGLEWVRGAGERGPGQCRVNPVLCDQRGIDWIAEERDYVNNGIGLPTDDIDNRANIRIAPTHLAHVKEPICADSLLDCRGRRDPHPACRGLCFGKVAQHW